jgi:hypothetical protein
MQEQTLLLQTGALVYIPPMLAAGHIRVPGFIDGAGLEFHFRAYHV